MGFWCKHEEEMADKTILPSAWEQMSISATTGKNVSFDRMVGSIFIKTVLYVFKCKKCGRARVQKEFSA